MKDFEKLKNRAGRFLLIDDHLFLVGKDLIEKVGKGPHFKEFVSALPRHSKIVKPNQNIERAARCLKIYEMSGPAYIHELCAVQDDTLVHGVYQNNDTVEEDERFEVTSKELPSKKYMAWSKIPEEKFHVHGVGKTIGEAHARMLMLIYRGRTAKTIRCNVFCNDGGSLYIPTQFDPKTIKKKLGDFVGEFVFEIKYLDELFFAEVSKKHFYWTMTSFCEE